MGRSVEPQNKLAAPTRKINSDDHEASILMHPNEDSRIVVLYGGVSEQSIAASIVQLLYLANQNHKPTILFLTQDQGRTKTPEPKT
mgnify:CR=1 FL=1